MPSSFSVMQGSRFAENGEPRASLRAGTGTVLSTLLAFFAFATLAPRASTQTVTTNGPYTVLRYTTVGSANFTVPAGVFSLEYVIVGGGGGGGSNRGGGGGAGGVRFGGAEVTPGAVYAVTVGAGGAEAASGAPSSVAFPSPVVAAGGGNGGIVGAGGGNGGSGGGAGAGTSLAPGSSSPVTIPDQGSAGGAGSVAGSYGSAGGGGGFSGAGGVGVSGSTAALSNTGGPGYTESLTGSSLKLAGGGGGGVQRSNNSATGGAAATGFGGGNGSGTVAAGPGTPGTGGGGGGGGATVSGVGSAGGTGGSGTVILRYVTPPPAPVNDAFANRSTLSGASASASGTNVAATAEAGEPAHHSAPAAKSVWWQWIAPGSGLATVSTAGSGFDTLLAVYTGSVLASLTPIASDDDGDPSGGNTSRVVFAATSGTAYQIAVDGFSADSGPISLSVALAAPPPNTAPVNTAPASVTGGEDTPIVFQASLGTGLSVSDADGNLSTMTITVTNGVLTSNVLPSTTNTGLGTSTVTFTGSAFAINNSISSLVFLPTPDYSGPATLTVLSTDSGTPALTDTDVVAITVVPIPDATPDALTTPEDTAVSANVLTGTNGATADTFAPGATLVAVTPGEHGTVTFAAGGTVTYTPALNYSGPDTFTYTVSSAGVTEIGLVNVTVTPVNDAPTLAAISLPATINTTFAFTAAPFTSAFSDIEGTALASLTVATLPATGTLKLSGLNVTAGQTIAAANLGNLTYVPATGESGAKTFTVTASDGAASSPPATVTLTLLPAPSSVVTFATASLSIGTFGEAVLVETTAVPSGAQIVGVDLQLDYSTYWPPSNPAYAGNYVKLNGVTIDPLGWGSLGNSNGWTPQLSSFRGALPAYVAGTLNTWTISSLYNPVGLRNLSFRVYYTGGNQAPTLAAISLAGTEDTTFAFTAANFTAAYSDPESAALASLTVVTLPATGSLRLSGTAVTAGQTIPAANLANLTYVPALNSNGPQAFTVTASDGTLSSAPATVTLTLAAVNDPPTQTVPAAATLAEDTPLAFTAALAISVADVDGNLAHTHLEAGRGKLAVNLAGGATLSSGSNNSSTLTLAGTVPQINAALATLVYTPDPDYAGPDSLLVLSTDAGALVVSHTVALTITPVADIVADTLTTPEDTALTANVLTGTNGASADTFENPAAFVLSVTQPGHGTVTFTAAGSVTYTPALNYNGPDSFTYTVATGFVTETATVTLNVTAVNDPPTLAAIALSGPANTPFPFNAAHFTAAYADPESAPLASITVVTLPATGTLLLSLTPVTAGQTILVSALSTLSYVPVAGTTGAITFTVTASDGVVSSAPSTVTLTLTDTQPPVLTAVSIASNNFTATRAKVGDTVTVTFTANEPLTSNTSNGGLLGWYPLDGNGLDPTATGPALTQPGAPVAFVPGLAGQAASFDGSSATWLRAAINAAGDTNPTFTWGAWVKLNNPSATTIFISVDNGGWDRMAATYAGQWSVASGGFTNSPSATSTEWTFIAQTFNGTTQTLYVDANAAFSAADPGNQSMQNYIDLGHNASGSAYALNGLLDGVFFFDQALTPTQIATIRAGGPSGTGVLSLVWPVVRATIAGRPATVTRLEGNTWSASLTLQSGDTPGPVPFVLNFADTANNPGLPVTATTDASSVTFDPAAPTVASVAVPANATYGPAQHLDFTVTFSEPLRVTTGEGTPRLGLTVGATSTFATFLSSAGATATFRYTVPPDALDLDGVTLGALTLNGGTLTDLAGNPATLTLVGVPSLAGVRVDAAAPAAPTLVRALTSPLVATSVTYTLTFAEAVTGVTADDFTLTLGSGLAATVASVTGSGPTYTITVNAITGAGTLRLDLKTGGTGIADLAANVLTAGAIGETYTLLNVAPVNTAPATATLAEDTSLAFTAALTLSVADANANLATARVTVTHGTLTVGLAGGATISAGANATTALTLAGTAPQLNAALATLTYTPAPDYNGTDTLTLLTTDTAASTDTDTITLTITPVADIVADTLTIAEDTPLTANLVANDAFASAATIITVSTPAHGTAVIASANTVTYTPAANYAGPDSFTYTVSAGGVTETAAVTVTVTAVNDAPVNTAPATATTNSDTALIFSAAHGNALSLADIDAGAASLTVTLTATQGALTLGSVAGLTFTTGNGVTPAALLQFSGPLSALNLALSGLTFTPAPGFSGAASLTFKTSDDGNTGTGGVLTATASVAITVLDTIPPTVVSLASLTPDGHYRAGAVIDVGVAFSEPVTVNTTAGTPTLLLETGATDRTATYLSGSGSPVLVFRYVVVAGDTTDDLNHASPTALSLNGATLTDLAVPTANPAILTLPATTPGTPGALATAAALVIDTTAPTVALSAPSAASTSLGPITYTITYADAHLASSTLSASNITLNRTSTDARLTTANATLAVSGTGLTRTVTLSNLTGDGTLSISLSAATATDLAGNSAPATGPSAPITVQNTFPLAIAAPPVSTSVAVNMPLVLIATVTGTAPTFQWFKDNALVPGATNATLELAATPLSAAGSYRVTATNILGSVDSSTATVAVFDVTAAQALQGPGYVPGQLVTVRHTVTFSGGDGTFTWSLLLPPGWSYAGGDFAGDTRPATGATALLEWTWLSFPLSPVTFTVQLAAPPGAAGPQALAAQVLFTRGATTVPLLAKPDPLLLPEIGSHTADTDRDGRFNLFELLRVIELYNTRFGTVRTGAYAIATAPSEDGFAPALTRATGAPVSLETYHVADTDRDAAIGLFELSRVIELFNYREGTVRTGAFHRQAGTEDGFAPGPAAPTAP